MTTRLGRGVALATLAGLAVAACTGGDDTTPTTLDRGVVTTTPSTATPSTVEPPDLTAAYFDAIAGGRPVPETVAVPGSDADRYAEFRSVVARLVDVGDSTAGSTPTTPAVSSVPAATVPGVVEVCDPGCTTYSDVAIEPTTGRLQTFAIDGVPLVGRIVGDGLRADDDGVIARVETAFRNQAGDVIVAVEVRNATDVAIELFGFSAVYQPAGVAGSREASGWWGPTTFDAGIGGTMLLAFDAVDADRSLGSGRISVSGLRDDGVAIALDLTLPRAGG